jgi:hypothetical protein
LERDVLSYRILIFSSGIAQLIPVLRFADWSLDMPFPVYPFCEAGLLFLREGHDSGQRV